MMEEISIDCIGNYNKLNERAKFIFDNCIILPPDARGYYYYEGFSVDGDFIVIKYTDVCCGESSDEAEYIPKHIFFGNNPVDEYKKYKQEQDKNNTIKSFKSAIHSIECRIKELMLNKESVMRSYKEFLIKNNCRKELDELEKGDN